MRQSNQQAAFLIAPSRDHGDANSALGPKMELQISGKIRILNAFDEDGILQVRSRQVILIYKGI